MAALDWITVEGFKSIKRVERLALRPINVLIGPNGSGKSNFIGVFSFLREIRAGRLREYVTRSGGADKTLHFGSRSTAELKLHVSFGGEVDQYEITLGTADPDALVPLCETCVGTGHELPATAGSAGGYPEAWISHRETHELDPELVHRLRGHLDSWRVYHVHDTSSASPIKKTADVDDNRFLRHDGANLAAFLYFLSHKHEDAHDRRLTGEGSFQSADSRRVRETGRDRRLTGEGSFQTCGTHCARIPEAGLWAPRRAANRHRSNATRVPEFRKLARSSGAVAGFRLSRRRSNRQATRPPSRGRVAEKNLRVEVARRAPAVGCARRTAARGWRQGPTPRTSTTSATTCSGPSSVPVRTIGSNSRFTGLRVIFVCRHETPSSTFSLS